MAGVAENNNNNNKKKILKWTDEIEDIIKVEGEKCQSFSWLHRESEKLYSYYNNILTIPAIILGTVNGSLSVGSQAIFGDFSGASVVIGFIGILCSILSTLNSYFSNGKRAEGHKIAALTYDNIYRLIMIEVGMDRKDRIPVEHFIKMIKEDLTKTNEIAPTISDKIITKYKNTFDSPEDVAIPNICNGLDKIIVHRITRDDSDDDEPESEQIV